MIDSLIDGLGKYILGTAQTYSGCMLLVVYWFAEIAPMVRPITPKKNETPTFLRWSTTNVINENDWFLNNNLLEVK